MNISKNHTGKIILHPPYAENRQYLSKGQVQGIHLQDCDVLSDFIIQSSQSEALYMREMCMAVLC